MKEWSVVAAAVIVAFGFYEGASVIAKEIPSSPAPDRYQAVPVGENHVLLHDRVSGQFHSCLIAVDKSRCWTFDAPK